MVTRKIHNRLAKLRARSRGFSMVEMMVALVVLSVGMLGVASLFATSLNSGSSAISRMQAVSLANDLADRIRSNATAQVAYQGAAANNNCVGGNVGDVVCAPAALAANDLFVWNQQITNTWPGGTASGQVTVTPVAGTALFSYRIQVQWTDPGRNTTPQSYTMLMQL